MSKYFIINTYDHISSHIISEIINIHPDIFCQTVNKDSLVPQEVKSA